MVRCVFLDRDGVINRAVVRDGKPYPPRSLEELELLEGVGQAVQKLHDAGFLQIVVTNQPDVARGTQSREVVESMHEFLMTQLAVDEVVACFHDGDTCDCRKPKPGALLRAAEKYDIDLKESYMVGDRWRDVEAGQRAGCTCLFIDDGYQERKPVPPFITVTSLAHAADWILAKEASRVSSQTVSQEHLP